MSEPVLVTGIDAFQIRALRSVTEKFNPKDRFVCENISIPMRVFRLLLDAATEALSLRERLSISEGELHDIAFLVEDEPMVKGGLPVMVSNVLNRLGTEVASLRERAEKAEADCAALVQTAKQCAETIIEARSFLHQHAYYELDPKTDATEEEKQELLDRDARCVRISTEAQRLLSQPHPGQALLARHAEELKEAGEWRKMLAEKLKAAEADNAALILDIKNIWNKYPGSHPCSGECDDILCEEHPGRELLERLTKAEAELAAAKGRVEPPQKIRQECKVCGNQEDDEGVIHHGKGCYVVSEEGGGETYVGP